MPIFAGRRRRGAFTVRCVPTNGGSVLVRNIGNTGPRASFFDRNDRWLVIGGDTDIANTGCLHSKNPPSTEDVER